MAPAAQAATTLVYLVPSSESPRPPTIHEIQAVVERFYGLTHTELIGRQMYQRMTWPRQVAVWLSSRLTLRSSGQIAHAFNGRDHTTILHAFRRVQSSIEHDPEVAAEIREVLATMQQDKRWQIPENLL